MKALIAIIVLLIVAGLGAIGFWIFNELTAGQAQPPSSAVSERERSVLTNMTPPSNDAEALDKLDEALRLNGDAVAWLEVPGTSIKNIVMQGDDNYYYERRNEDGEQDVYGCYFADYECAIGSRDVLFPNTVIYGHSDLTDNPDGPRFSQLFRFADEQFAKRYRYIKLTAPEGVLYWQIFAAFYTDIDFDYIRVQMTDAQMLEIAAKALSLSEHELGVSVTEQDKLLTLSTCSVRDGNDGRGRFVVMAKLCPEGFTPPEVYAPQGEYTVTRDSGGNITSD